MRTRDRTEVISLAFEYRRGGFRTVLPLLRPPHLGSDVLGVETAGLLCHRGGNAELYIPWVGAVMSRLSSTSAQLPPNPHGLVKLS